MKTHFVVLLWILAYLCHGPTQAAVPRDFAVDLKATVSDTAPHITLSWTQRVQSNITAQKIHRRLKGETVWVKQADLTTTQTSYVDNTAVPGTEYEYWMERTLTSLSPTVAMGYLAAGVKVPPVHTRGKLLLVVDSTMELPLAGEISQLRLDLAADGWEVRTIIAPRSGTGVTAASTKALIKAEYDLDPANVKAVYLLGHVPVPYSGNHGPDGHSDHVGAWPADGYYGEMNGIWTDTSVNNTNASRTQNDNIPGDGKFDLTYFNSAVELQVGRVDLHTMTKAPSSGVTEVQRLRRYLKRAHDFRHKQGAYAAIPRRTLIRDGFGHAFSSEPFAVTAWAGAFSSVGGTIDEAPSGQWFSSNYAGGKDYLWGHGCGGGSYESASSLGTTTDFGTQPSRVVFTSIFGSYHGDWDADNNLMRAAITGNAEGTSLGLCCFWAGRPNWFPHPLGMGETLGYMTRLTMNGSLAGAGGYKPGISSYGGTHVGLMGDPALRIHAVEPPRGLAATSAAGTVSLSWNPSGETALAGYHVYRADSTAGPFVKLTTDAVTSTSYDDATTIAGNSHVYLVRTMKLESVPGGSYYNLSTGSAVGVTVRGGTEIIPASPSDLAVAPANDAPGVLLTWSDNSAGETGFRIERKTGAAGNYAEIATTGANTTSYDDPGPLAQGNVFYYRVTALGADGDSFTSNEASYEAIAGVAEFVAGRVKVNKNAGTVTLNLERIGGSTGAVSVNYATTNSTATAGTHYSSTSGSVTWADGEDGLKTITVPITETAQQQLPRQFKVTISSPTGGLILSAMTTMAVQIEDPTATLNPAWTGLILGTVTDSSPAVSAEGVIGDSLIGGSGAVQDATSEAGRFIYQTRTGDQMITIRIPTGTVAQSSSRFAVMVRSSTATNAVMAATVTANSAANYGTRIVHRLTAGGAAQDTPDADNNLDTTRWLRLWRVGTTFTSQTSTDGVTWTTLGTATIPNMPPQAMWGIFHFSATLSATGYADYQLASYENAEVRELPVPAVPENFLAGAVTANSVPLTWTATLYAENYRITRQGGDGSWKEFTVANPATSFTDTTARADTAYTYGIVAANSRGSSGSASLNVMTPTGDSSPLRPGRVTLVGPPEGITVVWPAYAGTGQSGYEIERRVANGPWTPIGTAGAAAVSWTDTSPLPGVSYLYRVRAMRGAEVSAWTSPYYQLHDDTVMITGTVRQQGNAPLEVTPGMSGSGSFSFLHSAALKPYILQPGNLLSTRNDASGWFGMEIRTDGTPVEVRQLGRFVQGIGTGAHPMRLVHADSGVDVGSVMVNAAGAPVDAFKYTALPSPVTLAANSRYFLLSQETAGGDAWLDPYLTRSGIATGYQLWLLSQGLPMDGSGTGAAAAIAGSGSPLPNLVKYALGLPADVTGDGGRMQHAALEDISGKYLIFTYTHPFPAPQGVSYSVESCPNLSDWSTTEIVPVGETVSGGLRTVTVKVNSADPMKCFVRLKVVRE